MSVLLCCKFRRLSFELKLHIFPLVLVIMERIEASAYKMF